MWNKTTRNLVSGQSTRCGVDIASRENSQTHIEQNITDLTQFIPFNNQNNSYIFQNFFLNNFLTNNKQRLKPSENCSAPSEKSYDLNKICQNQSSRK